MPTQEHNAYPPGIYLEMYHANKDTEYSLRYGGLHAYLVHRAPDGEVYVLRGGQPTEKQSWFRRNTFGVFGGHIEVETGRLADSIDRNDGSYRPDRMVIPIAVNGDAIELWEKAKRRVEEIGQQRYDYDVTDSAQLFSSGAQNSNSVVAAALKEMGVNPLDVVPDDLVPHLPGIDNDLSHGPDEAAPVTPELSIPRTGREKPKPLNFDLLNEEERLREERKQREQKERQRFDDLNEAPDDRETESASASRQPDRPGDPVEVKADLRQAVSEHDDPGAPPLERNVFHQEAAELGQAAMAEPAELEAILYAEPADWNHSQLMKAMQSDAYWTSRHPFSDRIRSGVSKAFQTLEKRDPVAASRRGPTQPTDFPAPPASAKAADGSPLASAQKQLADRLDVLARPTGAARVSRAAQKAMNRVQFSQNPKRSIAIEPLKVDGDFGPKTRERARELLHDIGPKPLIDATETALKKEQEEDDFVRPPVTELAGRVASGFEPVIPR